MARGTWGGNADIHPLKVRISFLLGTSQCQTGFTLRDRSLTPSDPQDAAEHVGVWVNDHFRTLFHNTDRMLGVDVLDMTTGEGGATSFSNLTGTSSAATTVLLPSYVQCTVSLKGELRRRYGQGRMLWPCRFEDGVTQDILNPSGVTLFQGVIDSFVARYMDDGVTDTYRAINTHGAIDPRPATPTTPARPAVPPSWYDVTTARLNTVVSFVRSRKQGVGS